MLSLRSLRIRVARSAPLKSHILQEIHIIQPSTQPSQRRRRRSINRLWLRRMCLLLLLLDLLTRDDFLQACELFAVMRGLEAFVED